MQRRTVPGIIWLIVSFLSFGVADETIRHGYHSFFALLLGTACLTAGAAAMVAAFRAFDGRGAKSQG